MFVTGVTGGDFAARSAESCHSRPRAVRSVRQPGVDSAEKCALGGGGGWRREEEGCCGVFGGVGGMKRERGWDVPVSGFTRC